MSDAGLGDASYQEGEAWATFQSRDMFLAIVELSDLAYTAAVVMPALAPALRTILQRLEGDLAQVANETAVRSVQWAREALDAGQVRPDKDAAHHLRDLIISAPSAFGSVKIGLIAELDKAVNAQSGYGPYWRAIEEGSVAVGNVMTGRVLFGSFVGPGHDDAPRSEFSGVPGPGAEFLMGDPAGGLGTVEHEIEPRHFLRQGTEQAALYYGFYVRDLSRKYAREILALIV